MYRVRKRSSWEGVARPLGWLWARTTTVAFKARASVVIFRRLISLALGVPSLRGRTPRSLPLLSKQARKDFSFRAPKK